MRKISLLVALSLVTGICYGQSSIVKGVSRIHVPKVVRFQQPVQPITSAGIKIAPFTSKSTLISGPRLQRLVLNYRNQYTIDELSKRLLPLTSANRSGANTITFSGHYVPNVEGLKLEAQRYTKPEFQSSSTQAIQDMLVRAVRSKDGFGVIKAYEYNDALPEPKMTMFVLNPTTYEWTKYPGVENIQVHQTGAVQIQKSGNQRKPIQTPFGQLTPAQYTVLSTDGGKTGILAYEQQDVYNIHAARTHLNKQNNLVDREKPFYIQLTTKGEPVALPQEAADVFNIQAAYADYELKFAAYEGAPLFSTVQQVENWLKSQSGK